MHQKINPFVALAAVVIISAGAAWLVAKNQKEIIKEVKQETKAIPQIKPVDYSNWKNYRNENYGFELKYPQDWTVSGYANAKPELTSSPVFQSPGCFVEDERPCASLLVGNIHKAIQGENIESNIKFDDNNRKIAEKQIKISGENASFLEYFQGSYGRKDGKMGLVRQEIKTMHNGTIYRIYADEMDDDADKIKTSEDWESKALIDGMIASFKFIN